MKLGKILILIFFFTMLSACQTPIERAGSEHKYDKLKWNVLSKYSINRLKEFDLTVTAKVEQVNDSKSKFKLSNIKLTSLHKVDGLDLLSPNVISNFACGKVCVPLSSMKMQNSSVFSAFFEEFEGPLFEFYGKLMLINDKLSAYKKGGGDVFRDYMRELEVQNIRFDSLEDFLMFLDKSISREKVLEYAKNNNNLDLNKQYLLLGDDDGSGSYDLPTQEYNSTDDLPNQENSDETPDYLWSAKNNNLVNYKLTQDEQINENLRLEEESNLSWNYKKKESWSIAKARKLLLGSPVCSYSDNSFGIVKSIKARLVEVEMEGIIKVIIDGVIRPAPEGHIFSGHTDAYYLPLTGLKVFPVSDVARCNLGINND